jgi:hypothetical protein
VGDVSGKGGRGAMMTNFPATPATASSPRTRQAAAELNHLLFSAGIEEKFITMRLTSLISTRACR